MAKFQSELILVIRDDETVRYLNPELAGIDFRRWSLEHKNVPRGMGVQQCLRIMRIREIKVVEGVVQRLDAFDLKRQKGRRKSRKVTIRPFLIDFDGIVPQLRGFSKFDPNDQICENLILPERVRKVA